jgi:hypothetical protein
MIRYRDVLAVMYSPRQFGSPHAQFAGIYGVSMTSRRVPSDANTQMPPAAAT